MRGDKLWLPYLWRAPCSCSQSMAKCNERVPEVGRSEETPAVLPSSAAVGTVVTPPRESSLCLQGKEPTYGSPSGGCKSRSSCSSPIKGPIAEKVARNRASGFTSKDARGRN